MKTNIHINMNLKTLLGTSHLNKKEKTKLLQLCNKYSNVFKKPNEDLSFSNAVKHEILTRRYGRNYRYPYIHKEEVSKQITEMQKNNIIRPSQSPWSSPVWIVPKKLDASGKRKWRLVIDYRKTNEKTIDDKYPLPNITEILDRLGRCSYFSTVDLASGSHQTEMHPNSIKKNSLLHYEFIRMPFG